MKNNNHVCIDGSIVSFDSVTSDNFLVAASLAEAAILDEKASVAIFLKEKDSKWSDVVRIPAKTDDAVRPETDVIFDSKQKRLVFTIDGNCYKGALSGSPYHLTQSAVRKSNAQISLHDFFLATRNNLIDVFEFLNIKKYAYAAFSFFGKTRPGLIAENPCQFKPVSNAFDYQQELTNWFLSGNPHHFCVRTISRNYSTMTPHITEESLKILPPSWSQTLDYFPMSFLFMESPNVSMMRVDKLPLVNPYGPPTKIYLPLTNWGGNSLHPETGTLLKLPFPDKQPLYNLPEIQKAKSVVLCASLEDADGLKKANARQTDVAFTAFICDSECFDEVDWSPIDGKNLYMLISNQSGRSLAEEYLETNKVYMYLRQKLDKKKPITFIHREVEYPDIGIVDSVETVFNAYKSHPPLVRNCELVYEQEFNRRVAAITAFMSQTWAIAEQEADDDSDVHDRTKQMLIRAFLHRGNITMVHGPAKVGKTTFCLGCCALVILGKHGNALMKGSAITVPSDAKPGKVIYLMFDPNCANNSVKLKADVAKTYGLDATEIDNLIMLNMVGRGAEFLSDQNTIANEVCEAAEKQGTKGRALSLIVIDTTTLIGRDENSVMRAVVSFSSAFPKTAILCCTHDNASGEASGDGKGNGKISGMCTHGIKLEKNGNGIHFSFESSNDLILPFDSDGFIFKIVNSRGKMELVEPARSEDEARAAVKNELMAAGYSAEECAHQLGISESALRTAVRRSNAKEKK